MPDTRKQRRWLPRECLSKLKVGGGVKYQRCGITQWRSWSRLPEWMSAHEVDLKSLKHICFSLACILLSFFFLFFLFYFFYFILYYSFSVMVLTQLAFALAIFIFSSMLVICNIFFKRILHVVLSYSDIIQCSFWFMAECVEH